ncbi:MAG: PCMD domain-containing protein [Prevotella sp.]
MKRFLGVVCFSFSILAAYCQEKVVALKYGNMDSWVTRTIHESAVIGGDDKTLYEIGPNKHIDGNTPYRNQGGSPWGTSNVMAKVSGIVKTNNTVYREKRGNGHCARLETHIEKVKVLGLINIKVLAAGSLFLGDMTEPITGTKDGEKYQNWGVPFNSRPKALRYDYRFKSSGEPNRIKLTGFGGSSEVKGKDKAITIFLLQKRTEDAKGNITAKRVGTMVVTYDKSTSDWVNGATYEILYGDIRKNAKYNKETMALRSCDYARNSKGVNVLVKETGWAAANETPTHMLLQFTSSHGGAYIGSPGNTLWIDNVKLVY